MFNLTDIKKWQNIYKPYEIYEPVGSFKLRTTNNVFLEDVLDIFLQDENKRILVISGLPGMGKTTFLEDMSKKYASLAYSSIKDLQPDDEQLKELPPEFTFILPTNLSLRYMNNATDNLQRTIVKQGYKIPAEPPVENIFQDKSIKFIFFLDALDEINNDAILERIIVEINDIVATYPNCKIVLTSRPYKIPEKWKLEGQIQIEVVSEIPREEVVKHLAIHIKKPHMVLQMQEHIFGQDSNIIQIPLYLEPIVEFWCNFEKEEELKEDEEKERKIEELTKQIEDLEVNIEVFDTDDELDGLTASELDVSDTQSITGLVNQTDIQNSPPFPKSPNNISRIDVNNIDKAILPKPGILLQHIFDRLIKHDAKKSPFARNAEQQAKERKRILAKLAAVDLDGVNEYLPEEQVKEIVQQHYEWAIDIGLLTYNQNNLDEVGIKDPVIKIYFATQYILGKLLFKPPDMGKIKELNPGRFWEKSVLLLDDLLFDYQKEGINLSEVFNYLLPQNNSGK